MLAFPGGRCVAATLHILPAPPQASRDHSTCVSNFFLYFSGDRNIKLVKKQRMGNRLWLWHAKLRRETGSCGEILRLLV